MTKTKPSTTAKKTFAGLHKGAYGVIVLLLVAAGIILGCSLEREEPRTLPAVNTTGQLQGNISVWAWGEYADSLQMLALDFMQRHPDTYIEIIKHDKRDMMAMLNSGLANRGSGLPDVVVTDENLPAYLNKYPGGFMDMTDRLQPLAADFVPGFANIDSWQSRWYAAPWLVNPVALYYRSDIWQMLNADAMPPRTWADMLQQGQLLAAQKGIALLPFNSHEITFLTILLNENDTGVFDEQGNITIGGTRAAVALQLIAQYWQAGVLLPVNNNLDILTACKTGKLAAVVASPQFAGSLKAVAPEQSGKWGIMALPAFYPTGPSNAATTPLSLAINAYTGNAELAWEFIKYVTTDSAGISRSMESFSLLSAYKPCLSDEELVSRDSYFVGESRWGTFIWSAIHPMVSNRTADYLDSNRYIYEAQQRVLQGANAKSALRSAAEEISNLSGRKILY